MAKKKLFKTADEIFEGYGLPKPTGKRGRRAGQSDNRKVTLKARTLPSGNVQLYLYSFASGRATRFSVGLLNPETNEDDKARNVEILRMAEAEAGIRNADAIRQGYGLEPQHKRNVLLSDYLNHLICSNAFSKQTNVALDMLLHHVEIYRTAKIKISVIDRTWIEGFIRYLRSEAISRVTTIKKKHLTENTQARIFEMLDLTLSRAVRDKIIMKSPAAEIKSGEKPKPNKDARTYLTTDEVRKLMQTECKYQQVKQAFLFSVFTGLRWSDVLRLAWQDLHEDENGKYFHICMKKTRKPIKVYLSEIGATFLPERVDGQENARIFQDMPNNCNANRNLRQWAQRAGIKGKRISFHVARHTFATMMLNHDTPLEVVARMLGHARLSTTEIYAKILDHSIAVATLRQDEIFQGLE